MSLNAKRFEESKWRTAKKRAKSKERKRLDAQRVELNQDASIQVPDGVTVHSLDSHHGDRLRLFQQGFNGAKGLLGSLKKGTTMAEALEGTRNQWFHHSDWRTVLRELRALSSDPDMQDREDEFARKAGPYYLRPYKDWASKVFEVFAPNKVEVKRWDLVNRVLDSILDEYREECGGNLSAYSVDATANRLNDEASTGWPFFTSDWHTPVEFQGESISPIDWALREANKAVSTGDYAILNDAYYIMFTRRMYRGTEESVNLKATERPVQCSPLVERAIGAGIQQPLMELQRRIPYSQGHKGVWEMGKPIQDAFARYSVAFEADYSGFDASIRNDVLRAIFDRVLIPLFNEEDQPRVIALRDHYLHAKLWTPSGILESEHVGLMSGSILTNCLGMIYGCMAWKYFLARLDEKGVKLEATALGYSDDLAVFFDTPKEWETPDEIVPQFTQITAELGLIAHPDKQGVWYHEKKQVSFLGCIFFPHRVNEKGCTPIYPVMRMASKQIGRAHV